MLLIPVIDLLSGEVVRALAGERAKYRPQPSALCASAAPVDVMAAFLGLHPFSVVYIADLDAIGSREAHVETVATLLAAFPDTVFWLDAGFDTIAAVAVWPTHERLRPVLGSESQKSLTAYRELCAALWCEPVLSLDFDRNGPLGPAELHESADLWPRDIIVMTLDRVGVNQGPGLERVVTLKQLAPKSRLYAAGGLRHRKDAETLCNHGCFGVLVASALHDRRLNAADVAAIEASEPTGGG